MPCPVGALRTPCQPPCVARSWRQRDLGCTATIVFPRGRIFVLKQASGTLAVARLGGEHHTHSRAARKPILSRAYSARGGHGPAEPAPETHHSKACPTLAVARLGGEHHTPRAQRESPSFPESPEAKYPRESVFKATARVSSNQPCCTPLHQKLARTSHPQTIDLSTNDSLEIGLVESQECISLSPEG